MARESHQARPGDQTSTGSRQSVVERSHQAQGSNTTWLGWRRGRREPLLMADDGTSLILKAARLKTHPGLSKV